MTTAAVLIFLLLGGWVAHTIARALVKRNGALGLIILGAVLIRMFVAQVNIDHGPLPGAEIDAVVYVDRGQELADHYDATGHFEWEIGRLGYSNILALGFVFAGHNPFIPALINAAFFAAFLLAAHEIALMLMSRRRALLCAAAIAFYPAGILYTAVPLRESVLMWAMALVVYGGLRYLAGDARMLSWRVISGIGVLVWLHSGFAVLGAWLPLLWYWRSGGQHKTSRAHRLVPVFLGLVGFVILFVAASRFLPKLPDNPSDLMSLDYLNNAREFKASYGTGYAASAGTSWASFILRLPLLVFGFLLSPLPGGFGGGFSGLIKVIDALTWLGLLGLSTQALRTRLPEGRARSNRLALLTFFALLVLMFAVGTANVGIAVRHRAKFAWLLMALIAAWRKPNEQDDPVAADAVRLTPIPLEVVR